MTRTEEDYAPDPELLAEVKRLRKDLDSYRQGAAIEAREADKARAETRRLRAVIEGFCDTVEAADAARNRPPGGQQTNGGPVEFERIEPPSARQQLNRWARIMREALESK